MPSRRPKKKKHLKRDHGGQSGDTRQAKKGTQATRRKHASYSTLLGLEEKYDLMRGEPN